MTGGGSSGEAGGREVPDSRQVRAYLVGLQEAISERVRATDQAITVQEDSWEHASGGGGRSRAFTDGGWLEKGGVNFSHVIGKALPEAASARRPQLAGQPFEAMGVSLVFHPRNPHVPTTHMNVRYFEAGDRDDAKTWWFGGGFDLTPYYARMDDVVAWHRAAKAACDPFGDDLYGRFKAWCDDYFFIKHRNETRGAGGLFFDDFNEPGFARSFAFMQSVGDAFAEAYFPIVERRRDVPFGQRERDFQRYRRGRYVEFNLVYDRGTLFGLQSGGRTESILMSMPPEVRFVYCWSPEPNTPEADLYKNYLHPRDWLAEATGGG